MKYDITTKTPPPMPALGKGMECVKLLLSQASKDMHEPLVPMLFPILGAHVKGVEFQYPDHTWKELCGMMANLVADSGCNKGQLTGLVEATCRDFRTHDDAELQKLVAWQRMVKGRSANKDKPIRPEVAFLFPPADVTSAAFLQNAMACEAQGGLTQYLNLPEVEMANGLCGGHGKVTQTLRNIYDRQRAGALRATADGVTGNPTLRANFTMSSTPYATRRFYKGELFNGTFGRVVMSYRPETTPDGRIPRVGKFTDAFYGQLDDFLARLTAATGRFVVKPLNKLTDQLAEDMADLALLADDKVLWGMSKRAIVSAWKCGCLLWLLHGQQWTRAMADMVEWLAYHDLWSKFQVFADLLAPDEADVTKKAKQNGVQNMLEQLPNTFSQVQLDALRAKVGKDSGEGTKHQLRTWRNRAFITFDEHTQLYTKTEAYLKSRPKGGGAAA